VVQRLATSPGNSYSLDLQPPRPPSTLPLSGGLQALTYQMRTTSGSIDPNFNLGA
jgi:hypothetical protein